ncbi:MAG TPA: PAS domain-containing protein [Terriglobales bacterium]|nr:PAS domain-containing protein [Terriglobales bacterium]
MAAAHDSGELLLDLYENAPCGFHSLDTNGTFVRINDTELNWLGYLREEMVGHMTLSDILTPEGRKTFERNFPRFKAGGVLRDVELDFVRKDGTLLPVLVSATAVRDHSGNVVMSRSIVYDLSQRKQADSRFRSILEAAPDAMLICNRQGEIRLTNAQVGNVFGYRGNELQGCALDVLLPDRFRQIHAQHLQRFFAHPQTRPMGSGLELSGLRKDRTEVPLEISLSPLQTDEGLQALAAIRDVTERRRAQANQRKSEARYRLLFENSIDGVLLTSPDGRIFDVNASACSIFGRTREQIIAAGRAGLMDSTDPALLRLIEERKRTGKARGELRARRPDGTVFPVEISSAVFVDAERNELTCIILRDIGPRKQAEAERERLITDLQEALSQVKVLSGLLPICASCKKIRDEKGQWNAIEKYIRERSDARFTHGICPDCALRLYPEHYGK